MAQGKRVEVSAAQRSEIWRRTNQVIGSDMPASAVSTCVPANKRKTGAADQPVRVKLRLENLTTSATVRGVSPDQLVSVVVTQWHGSEVLELTFKTQAGRVGNELLFRHDEKRLELVEIGGPSSFDSTGVTGPALRYSASEGHGK